MLAHSLYSNIFEMSKFRNLSWVLYEPCNEHYEPISKLFFNQKEYVYIPMSELTHYFFLSFFL